MKFIPLLAAALAAFANAVDADTTTSSAPSAAIVANAAATSAAVPAKTVAQGPAVPAMLNVFTLQGCYNGTGELTRNHTEKTDIFNSQGSCADLLCKGVIQAPVAALGNGNECYCGKKYPPKGAKVADSLCNIPCPGFPEEACGGIGYYTLYNTGLSLNPGTAGKVPQPGDEDEVDGGGDSSSDSSSSSSMASSTSTTGSPAVVTVSGVVTVVTETSSSTNEAPAKSGVNTAGIAAGVVVGVVVLAAAIGGMFFVVRRRRNKAIEEEHRRNAAVNSFTGGRSPSTSGRSISDARLDPVMAQRRMSDGSIADNHDYSRKILRVSGF
ncbi:hypothetical protein B0T17DRAFT_500739 [Bombardia bombarda]|uniref:WSC domain-containing protein n=1 Tax=Bombardia bombarda TaxID=252184 RepID=A0AA39WAD6_9PEZI|nr:hypothetical protein B0T17DRAFT_500739 [Bombardia bombarda]